MRLQAYHAVENLHAGIFHAPSPANIRGLVEAGHQLHDHSRFLRSRRLRQRLEHRRIRAGAIKRLLHRHHSRVDRSLLDEAHHRVVGIIGMVQQNIPLTQVFKEVRNLPAQIQLFGSKRREFEIRPLNIAVKEHQAGQIHRSVGLVYLRVRPARSSPAACPRSPDGHRSQSPGEPRRPCAGYAARCESTPAAIGFLLPQSRGLNCASRGKPPEPALRSPGTCR